MSLKKDNKNAVKKDAANKKSNVESSIVNNDDEGQSSETINTIVEDDTIKLPNG